MVKIIIVEKGGSVKEAAIKNLKLADLYKKCNFRKNDNFDSRATWKHGNAWVSLYSRNDGRAGTENKYELPPPIDKDLYFGSLAFIKHKKQKVDDNSIIDFTKGEFSPFIEKLFGGFEDLNDTESYSEEEVIPDNLKTKDGYMKDGFVVDDSDGGEDDEDVGEEDDENVEDDDDSENTGSEIYSSDGEEVENVDDENNDIENESLHCGGIDNDSDKDETINSDYSESELSEEDYDY